MTQIRPGRNSLRIAFGLAVLSVGTLVWTPCILLVCGGAVLTFLAALLDRRLAFQRLGDLAVLRTLPPVIGRDVEFTESLIVTNSGEHSIRGEIRDVLPDVAVPDFVQSPFEVAGESSRTLSHLLQIPIRGLHQFGPVWIRVSGPLGLVELQREFETPGELRVLPEQFASRGELFKQLGEQARLLDKITTTRQHGTGTEFESLHPFREGDDPRRIDWRATAKHRFPIVRRFQVERHRDVMILIDCGRLMGATTETGSKLDCAVDAALNLSRVALQSGDRCGVAAYDRDVRGFLPPQSGLNSLGNIVESVYSLEPRYLESSFGTIHATMQTRQTKRSLLVVLSDLSDAETSRMQCAALKNLSQRHLVLFAALRTPLLGRMTHRVPETVAEGSRQAVAFRLLRDRNRALHALQRSGVHVLDVEPHALTVPLVNQFIDLRQRNLL